MTASSPSRLTDLQRRFLEAFARRSPAFFLSGGAVLAGWTLAHRQTEDVDLFTTDDHAMSESDRLVRGTAAEVGASVESIQSHPDFKRYLLRAGGDSMVVDVVRDRAPQLYQKIVRDGIRMDAVEEIVANKICALIGRSEVRDLVDLYFLERAGYPAERFIGDAARKDGGVTAATFAWVLSGLAIPSTLPAGLEVDTLRAFAKDLEQRMRRLAGRESGADA